MAALRACFFLLICCASTIFFVGCGKKSMLVPPQNLIPEQVTDVQYAVDQSGVVFSWSAPRFFTNGDTLAEVAGFDVQIAEVSPEQFCEGCPVPYGEGIRIPGGRVTGQKCEYRLENMRPGFHYFFRVRTRANRWAAGRYSEAVFLVWRTVNSEQ
jgi:hypothetical protein